MSGKPRKQQAQAEKGRAGEQGKTGYRKVRQYGERGNRLTIFSEAPSGTPNYYYQVPDSRVPSGTRTRSLRTHSEAEAVKWAEEIMAKVEAGELTFDDIPEIRAKPKKAEPEVKDEAEPTISKVIEGWLRAEGTKPTKTDQRRAQMFANAVGGEPVSGWSAEAFMRLRATGAINPLGETVSEDDRKPVSERTAAKDARWLEKVLEHAALN